MVDLPLEWGHLASGTGLALNMYRNRAVLAEIWTRGLRWLGMQEIEILVTGASGVGKTQLVDLLGEVSGRHAYIRPGTSLSTEERAVTVGSRSLLLSVVPGQETRARFVGLNEAFASPSLRGVLHVVADGFASPRSVEEGLALGGDRSIGDLGALRERNRQIELTEFRTIASLLTQRWVRDQRPRWLCVAVNKADLYWPEVGQTYGRYGLDQAGPFGRELTRLVDTLGRANARVAVVPSVAWTEEFAFREERVAVSLTDEATRRAITGTLLATLDRLEAP